MKKSIIIGVGLFALVFLLQGTGVAAYYDLVIDGTVITSHVTETTVVGSGGYDATKLTLDHDVSTGSGTLASSWTSEYGWDDGVFDVLIDQDPSVTYSFAVYNNTIETKSYHFTFGGAINPIDVGYKTDVTSSISMALTDLNVSGAALLTVPGAAPTSDMDGIDEMHVVSLSADGGSTLYNFGHDLGMDFVIGSGSDAAVYNETDGPRVEDMAWNWMQIDIDFDLSPGDFASFSGKASIDNDFASPVPVPAAIWLLMSGICGLGIMKRKISG